MAPVMRGAAAAPPSKTAARAPITVAIVANLAFFHTFGNVPLVNVGDLMGQDPGQLILPFHETNDTGIDKNIATGYGKGVIRRVL